MKNKILSALTAILSLLGGILWFSCFSDQKHQGYFSQNDKINLVFFILFFAISIFSSIKFMHIDKICKEFTKAKVALSIGEKDEKIKPCFSNNMKNNFEAYCKEKGRLLTTAPNGCGCRISNYINEKILRQEIGSEILNLIPSICTALGLLGTFVGLTLGLNDMILNQDLETMSNQISDMISSFRMAFITSIFGVFLSVVFNIQYKEFFKNLQRKMENFVNLYEEMTQSTSFQGINKLLDNQTNQTLAMNGMANTVSQGLSDLVEAAMEKMQFTYEAGCKRLEEAQQVGMNTLVEKFTREVTQNMQKELEAMSKAIHETCAFQEEATIRIKENIDNIDALSNSTKDIYRISSKTLTQLRDFSDKMDENTQSLTSIVESNNNIFQQTLSSFSPFMQSIESLNHTVGEIGEYSANLRSYNNASLDTFRHINEGFQNQLSLLENLEKDIKQNLNQTAQIEMEKIHTTAQNETQNLKETLDLTQQRLHIQPGEHQKRAVSFDNF